MMKLKIEASGWPAELLAPEDYSKEAVNKSRYIARNEVEYGIKLDVGQIEENAGKRHVAKIAANSFWGRWSMRNNMTQDLITESPQKLYKLLADPKLEKGAVEMLSPTLFAVPFTSKSDFVESHDKYNIVLALYTTSYARIRLYE